MNTESPRVPSDDARPPRSSAAGERNLRDAFAEQSKQRPPIFLGSGRGLATAAVGAIAAVLLVLQLLGVTKSAPAERMRKDVEGRAVESPATPPSGTSSANALPPGLDKVYASGLRVAVDAARRGDVDAIAELPSLASQAPDSERRPVRRYVLSVLAPLAKGETTAATAAQVATARILSDDPGADPEAAEKQRKANDVPPPR